MLSRADDFDGDDGGDSNDISSSCSISCSSICYRDSCRGGARGGEERRSECVCVRGSSEGSLLYVRALLQNNGRGAG